MKATLLGSMTLLLIALPAVAQIARPAGQPNPFTMQNVDKAKPFGALDTTAVDPKDSAKVAAWAKALTEPEKLELSDRCRVINANAFSFLGDDVSLCQFWVMAQAGDARN